MKSIGYSKGAVLGKLVRDQVCIAPNDRCAKDFEFLEVVFIKDLHLHAGGILGLGAKKLDGSRQLFVPALYEQGAIQENRFTVSVTGDVPLITFGGPVLPNLIWHKAFASSDFWKLQFEGVFTEEGKNIGIQKTKVFFDSGTS